jgi:hypothetical protein
MLAFSPDHELKPDAWEGADQTVQLPESLATSFFDKRGPMRLHHENNRSYHRYFMRAKALLKRGDLLLGVYTKDVSRQGVGFLSPVELLPLESIELLLPDARALKLVVARCRRLDDSCFECGAGFALATPRHRSN